MSEKAYRQLILVTIYLPYVLVLHFLNYKFLPVIILGLIPAFVLTKIALRKSGAELNEGLKFSGVHLVVFSLLLCGVFLSEHQV